MCFFNLLCQNAYKLEITKRCEMIVLKAFTAIIWLPDCPYPHRGLGKWTISKGSEGKTQEMGIAKA